LDSTEYTDIHFLKHENGVLALDRQTKKIVVVGEHADNAGLQPGGWTIRWQGTHESYPSSTTILEGIRKYAEGDVVYDKNASGDHLDADVAIVVVGETPYAEAAGDIRDDGGAYSLTLSKEHQRYITAYSRKGPDLVVLLVSGRPLIVGQQIDQSDAFIAA
jgi:beta-glucosidase